MFRIQLLIFALLCFFFFLQISIFAFSLDFHTPVSLVDSIAISDSPGGPISSTPKPRRLVLVFGRLNTVSTIVIIVITLLNIIVYKLREIQDVNLEEKLKVRLPLRLGGRSGRCFSLAEILSATHNFDDALVIGEGGFGKVYKGVVDNGTLTIAIKRLNPMSSQGAPEFWTEIEMLSSIRHSHIVSLIGYCNQFDEMILVYEYMVRGTLADHIYKIGENANHSTLSWVQRLKICIGAAHGLDYLHTGTGLQHRVIHRDVKSSNILLDENLAAKISDFGMSKIGPANQSCTHVSTNVKGTFGYLDPEYLLTHKLTRKSDVFAFGVVLFEVLCGRRAVDLSLEEEQWGLAGWAHHCIKDGTLDKIKDPNLRWEIVSDSLAVFAKIADQCLDYNSKKRPTMAEVVVALELALYLQEKRDSFVFEGDLFNIDVADDIIEEIVNSNSLDNGFRLKKEVINAMPLGDGRSVQSRIKPAKKMALTRKVRFFFSGTDGETMVHSDTKLSKNSSKGVGLKIFTLDELKIATGNFRPNMLFDQGGSGNIFTGWVNEKTHAPSMVGLGIPIAARKCNPKSFVGAVPLTVVEGMAKASHPNLARVLGYCLENNERLLVYEYTDNGSLASHLFRKDEKPLTWFERLKIAIGAAKAFVFLHKGVKSAVYLHFKACNILLDGDLNAKLLDFEPLDSPCVSKSGMVVMKNYAYLAPENVAAGLTLSSELESTSENMLKRLNPGYLTMKSDVYSFGVVLLEILTGQRAFDGNRANGMKNLVEWARARLFFILDQEKLKEIIDPRLGKDYPARGTFQLAQLILECLECFSIYRPTMEEVLKTLESINAIRDESMKSNENFHSNAKS